MASLRVLLLSRDADLADAFRILVVEFGHEARVYANEEVALAETIAFRPHVVFIDQNSTDEGAKLCAHLKANTETPTRLVAICGRDSYDRLPEFRAVGFDFRFSRPLNASDLERFLAVSKGSLSIDDRAKATLERYGGTSLR